MTLSPTLKRLHSPPTSTIVPQGSCPQITGDGCSHWVGSRGLKKGWQNQGYVMEKEKHCYTGTFKQEHEQTAGPFDALAKVFYP
eukprot:m.116519 g.116519  ORF g.116519 m.116519 type:complete len:84 (+) comp15403_c2_seq6:1209-1460(+)